METPPVVGNVNEVLTTGLKPKPAENIASNTNGNQPSSTETGGNKPEAVERLEFVATVDFSQRKINEMLGTSLSFSVEEDLGRVVVAVRAVGSDEIIRQFPPDEFITVAKYIASQDSGMVDQDYLKGVLFDKFT